MSKASLKMQLCLVCIAAVLIISGISNVTTAQVVEQSYQPVKIEIAKVTPSSKPAKITKVTPSDVFGAIELLNRSVIVMLEARQARLPQPPDSLETGLGPMHVYQLLISLHHLFHSQTDMVCANHICLTIPYSIA